MDDILGRVDKEIKEKINNNDEEFLVILKETSTIKGIKWDDILLRFSFNEEHEKIRELLSSKNQ